MMESPKIQKGQEATVIVCYRMGGSISRKGIVSKVGGTWFRVLADEQEYTFNRKTCRGSGAGHYYCEFPNKPS